MFYKPDEFIQRKLHPCCLKMTTKKGRVQLVAAILPDGAGATFLLIVTPGRNFYNFE